jgi:competence protein ComEC
MQKPIRTLFLSFSVIIFSLSACAELPEYTEPETLRIEFLDVGQGDAILIKSPSGQYFMIDGGSDQWNLAGALQSRGVEKLDWVALTHMDRDHYGGFLDPELVRKVQHFYKSSDPAHDHFGDSLLNLIQALDLVPESICRNAILSGMEPFEVRVLWPPCSSDLGGNASSLVLKISDQRDHSILLTGDLDSASESLLLELEPALKSDVLKVAHHGSAQSSSLLFLAAVLPEFAVLSLGENSYGHPAQSVLQKLSYFLNDSNSILRTDQLGDILLEWSPGSPPLISQ